MVLNQLEIREGTSSLKLFVTKGREVFIRYYDEGCYIGSYLVDDIKETLERFDAYISPEEETWNEQAQDATERRKKLNGF